MSFRIQNTTSFFPKQLTQEVQVSPVPNSAIVDEKRVGKTTQEAKVESPGPQAAQEQRAERVYHQELPTFRGLQSNMLSHRLHSHLDGDLGTKAIGMEQNSSDLYHRVHSGGNDLREFAGKVVEQGRRTLDSGMEIGQTAYELLTDPSKASEFRQEQIESSIEQLDEPGDKVTFRLGAGGKVNLGASADMDLTLERNPDGTVNMSMSGNVAGLIGPSAGAKGALSIGVEGTGSLGVNTTYTFQNAEDANRALRISEMAHREFAEYVDGTQTLGGRSAADFPPSPELEQELAWLAQQPRTVQLGAQASSAVMANLGLKRGDLKLSGISGNVAGGVELTAKLTFEGNELQSVELIEQANLRGGIAGQLQPGKTNVSDSSIPGASTDGTVSLRLSQTFQMDENGLNRLEPSISMGLITTNQSVVRGEGTLQQETVSFEGVPSEVVSAMAERALAGDLSGMAAAAGDQVKVKETQQTWNLQVDGIPKVGFEIFGFGAHVEASRTNYDITQNETSFDGTATDWSKLE